MARPGYIFILGMDRTGTTLTRDILNCSKEIGLAGEAQYFKRRPHWSFRNDHGYRQIFAKMGDISTENGAEKVVEYIFSEQEKPSRFWYFSQKSFNREDFLRRFLETDRSERAFFDLALVLHANGKPIRGEKTPANIYFVPKLLEWFPNTKIIHTFRDPRAIYASRMKKKEKYTLPLFNRMIRKTGIIFELYSSSITILGWQQAIQFHRRYKACYSGRYYLSKYEDLIRDPETALRNVCNFLEVDFIEEMLQPTVVNSSFVPKGQSPIGFDVSAIDRWRKHVHPLIYKWITLCCKKQLLEFGYRP